MKNLLLSVLVVLSACATTEEHLDQSWPFMAAFGSCADQSAPAPVWDQIKKQDPDLFIFLGDNVYAEPDGLAPLKKAWSVFSGLEGPQSLMKNVRYLETWDDHDFGVNDAGREVPFKSEAQKLFLNAFHVRRNDPRRRRSGVYYSEDLVVDGNMLKVIVLDTRYFRDPWKKAPKGAKLNGTPKFYEPDASPEKTLLGKDQWKWLEMELKQPFSYRIIVSSIQLLSLNHGFEKWGNFPKERERILNLISETGAGRTLILSGDRHFAAFYEWAAPGGGSLTEFTSSGLNKRGHPGVETDPLMVEGNKFIENNYGTLELDFTRNQAKISVVDVAGKKIQSRVMSLGRN